MDWQYGEYRRIATELPAATVRIHGSSAAAEATDGWSDLDLELSTDRPVPIATVASEVGVWAYEDVRTPTGEVCRTVLADGRRIDISINGTGRIDGLEPQQDNDFRFIAAMAATRIGRGDRLIGGHLVLELIRSCLVVAMQLRDRDLGTTVHRHGGDRDQYAEQAMSLASLPLEAAPRPNVVERTAGLYATWRNRLEPDYRPDWSALAALIDRGLAH